MRQRNAQQGSCWNGLGRFLEADEGEGAPPVFGRIAVADTPASGVTYQRLVGTPEGRTVGRDSPAFGDVQRSAQCGLRETFVKHRWAADLGRHESFDDGNRIPEGG